MRTTLEALTAALAIAFAVAAPAAVVVQGITPETAMVEAPAGSPADVSAALLDCEADCMSVGQSPARCEADCATDEADGVRQ